MQVRILLGPPFRWHQIMNLYPHQQVGAEWLAGRSRAMLFDEQGLGKTITVIAAADLSGTKAEWREINSPAGSPIESILVIAPSVVLHNWAKEFEKWSPTRTKQIVAKGSDTLGTRVSVVIVSHTLFHSPRIFAQILDSQWDLVVVDEAHNFRNREAQRTQALYGSMRATSHKHEHLGIFTEDGLADHDCVLNACDRMWGLTGTPVPNNVSELWTHLRALFPDSIPNEQGDPMSFAAFRSRYCKTRPTRYGLKVVGNKNLSELKKRTAPVTLRRLKADVLDLPEVRFETVALTPTKLPWEFEALAGEIKDLLADADDPTAAQGFAALRASSDYARFRRWCGMAKVEQTVEMIAAELEFGALDKVVIFAHHSDVVADIAAGLDEFGVRLITGATYPKFRNEAVEQFQNDPKTRVMVCNIVAGGVGITLTAASDVVFAEMSFVPGENAQAADRCHRIGQTKRVRVRCLALAGSIDSDIVDILTLKTRMIREVLS